MSLAGYWDLQKLPVCCRQVNCVCTSGSVPVVSIGVQGFHRSEQVTLPKIVMQPFRNEPAVRAFLKGE